MTGSLIAPVIPSAVRASADQLHGARGAQRLRLAEPLLHMADASDVVYGLGRIDASGRIADRAVTCTLGWSSGDRLTLTAEAGVVVARRDSGGMVTMPVQPANHTHSLHLKGNDLLMAVMIARNAQDAEDAVAETYLNAFRRWDQLRAYRQRRRRPIPSR